MPAPESYGALKLLEWVATIVVIVGTIIAGWWKATQVAIARPITEKMEEFSDRIIQEIKEVKIKQAKHDERLSHHDKGMAENYTHILALKEQLDRLEERL